MHSAEGERAQLRFWLLLLHPPEPMKGTPQSGTFTLCPGTNHNRRSPEGQENHCKTKQAVPRILALRRNIALPRVGSKISDSSLGSSRTERQEKKAMLKGTEVQLGPTLAPNFLRSCNTHLGAPRK